MIIRKANKDDIKILNYMSTLFIEEEKIDNNDFKKNYEKYINDNKKCLIVAEEDKKIVGYLYGYLIDDIKSKHKKSIIDILYVMEDYRNNGVASLLMDSFKKWSINNKVTIIEIDVSSENMNINMNIKSLCNKYDFNVKREIMICTLK